MTLRVSLALILSHVILVPGAEAAQACSPPTISSATTAEEVRAHFKGRGRTVLTFLGYSGADYEDRAAMLTRAAAVLDTLDPTRTIVNIGATIDGIGMVYELAHNKGFETTGIVSSQARTSKATLAPCAGAVFFIADDSWGGLIEGTTTLSPTSMTLVSVSDRIVAIGGGDIARHEFEAARRLGKKTEFIPADMNHAIARARAARNGLPPPPDFGGELGRALASRR